MAVYEIVNSEVPSQRKRRVQWSQYKAAVAASLSLMAGGAWFTWPAPLLPRLLAPDSPVPMSREHASWMIACVEIGSLFSAYPASVIADRFGRKFTMLVISPWYLMGVVLTVYVKTFPALCAARFVQGMAGSVVYATLPLYLGEVASPEVRGTVTSLFHIAWGVGNLIPYCVGPYLSYDSLTYFVFSLTCMSVLCFAWEPESPYYYAMRGHREDAARMLRRLRDHTLPEEIQRELEEIQQEVKEASGRRVRFRDMVATSQDRRAITLLLIVGTVSLLSGQNAILTYTTDTFSQLPNNVVSPDTITVMIGVVGLFGSVFSVFTSDKFGRRFLLLFSASGCMISLFITSAFFYLNAYTTVDVSNHAWVASLTLISYNMFITAGMHPVCVTYSSELFPTKTRSLASSLNNLNMTICSFLVLKMYITISSAMGVYFPYLLFGGNCMIGVILFYFWMPETKGKTFLEIREMLKNKQLK